MTTDVLGLLCFSELLKKKKNYYKESLSHLEKEEQKEAQRQTVRRTHTHTHRYTLFWRTTIKKNHLPISKHNNQGQLIFHSLHPKCYLEELLLRIWF